MFQEYLLPLGKWLVRGTRVAPEDITKTALLTIEGELDDISGLGQTAAAHDLCTGIAKAKHAHIEVKGAGALRPFQRAALARHRLSRRSRFHPEVRSR